MVQRASATGQHLKIFTMRLYTSYNARYRPKRNPHNYDTLRRRSRASITKSNEKLIANAEGEYVENEEP
jgi:hypothetical protein